MLPPTLGDDQITKEAAGFLALLGAKLGAVGGQGERLLDRSVKGDPEPRGGCRGWGPCWAADLSAEYADFKEAARSHSNPNQTIFSAALTHLAAKMCFD